MNNKHIRFIFLYLSFFFLIFASSTAWSGPNEKNYKNYPKHTIKMVIPYPPGGASDIIFRLYAKYASKVLGQPVVPINIKGATSTTGSRKVKNAKPDGYTILGSHNVIATAYLTGVVNYSYGAFETVALLTQTPNILTTNHNYNFQNAKQLLKYIKKHPKKIKWGVTPGGTDNFFAAEFLGTQDLTLKNSVVPASFQGTGPVIKALLSGEIDVGMTNVTSGKGYFKSGTLVPLGIAYGHRIKSASNIPTLKEQGIDMVNATSRGIFAPKGTPAKIIQRLQNAFKKAGNNPAVKKRIKALGSVQSFLPSKKATAYYNKVQDKLTKISQNMVLKR
jgi:tripartite-type tricarboxylate transporter receptor subunit TctC